MSALSCDARDLSIAAEKKKTGEIKEKKGRKRKTSVHRLPVGGREKKRKRKTTQCFFWLGELNVYDDFEQMKYQHCQGELGSACFIFISVLVEVLGSVSPGCINTLPLQQRHAASDQDQLCQSPQG